MSGADSKKSIRSSQSKKKIHNQGLKIEENRNSIWFVLFVQGADSDLQQHNSKAFLLK